MRRARLSDPPTKEQALSLWRDADTRRKRIDAAKVWAKVPEVDARCRAALALALRFKAWARNFEASWW